MCTQEIEKKQRDFARIPGSIRIEISRITYPLPEGPEAGGLGKNIGGGGVCFSSFFSYQPGTVLNLKMHIKGWQNYKKNFSMIFDIAPKAPLSVIAEVVWSTAVPARFKYERSEYERSEYERSGYETGVKFLDIYEDDYKALLGYLEKQAKN